MPDWIADPRLGQVAFGSLKAFMLKVTSDTNCDESTRFAVSDAMTKFSLATLAEERKIDLLPLLEAAPLASPSRSPAPSHRRSLRSSSSSAAAAATAGGMSDAVAAPPAVEDPLEAAVRETAAQAAEALHAAEDAARLAAFATSSAETSLRELAVWQAEGASAFALKAQRTAQARAEYCMAIAIAADEAAEKAAAAEAVAAARAVAALEARQIAQDAREKEEEATQQRLKQASQADAEARSAALERKAIADARRDAAAAAEAEAAAAADEKAVEAEQCAAAMAHAVQQLAEEHQERRKAAEAMASKRSAEYDAAIKVGRKAKRQAQAKLLEGNQAPPVRCVRKFPLTHSHASPLARLLHVRMSAFPHVRTSACPHVWSQAGQESCGGGRDWLFAPAPACCFGKGRRKGGRGCLRRTGRERRQAKGRRGGSESEGEGRTRGNSEVDG